MRETGYYWAKLYGDWLIFYYNSARKCFEDCNKDYFDDEFDKIDERQIKRK